jgi:ABC transporter
LLAAPAGTVLGVLGPNGAGKTTVVRVLTTLTRPDAGVARVAGMDVVAQPRAVQARIGVAAQDATVDGVLTGRQNLVMIGRLSGLGRSAARARSGELLKQFELAEAADREVKGYSGGMRRRLDLDEADELAPVRSAWEPAPERPNHRIARRGRLTASGCPSWRGPVCDGPASSAQRGWVSVAIAIDRMPRPMLPGPAARIAIDGRRSTPSAIERDAISSVRGHAGGERAARRRRDPIGQSGRVCLRPDDYFNASA